MASTIEFWGGLGVIGSSKVLIRNGRDRVLLDFGLDIPHHAELFRAPVRPRPGRELSDRLRVGGAPRLPGIYAQRWLDPTHPVDAEDAATSVFISHPHIDHVGLAGFVDDAVSVYAHTDTVDVMEALAETGNGLPGQQPKWQRLSGLDVITVGDMTVECIPVDHDVPGASGYLVRTESGTLAYTGDMRFHGRHPKRTEAFVDRVTGCDVLVTEGTTLGWTDAPARARSEDDVEASLHAAITESAGLVLASAYSRDVERAAAFIQVAAETGRRYLWPAPVAALLHRLGVVGVEAWNATSAAEVRADPSGFVVQPDPDDLPALLDLPVIEGTVLIHANGEPLGSFDPRWSLFHDWTAQLGVEVRMCGTSGHAMPADLQTMVERIAPRVVFPIHTTAPQRLVVPPSARRVIAEYGRSYDFAGEIVSS